MQNCDSTLLEVYVTYLKGQGLGNPAAQAKQKPDKQTITLAISNPLHLFYVRRVQISFNPSKISYREILKIFFSVHDPTTLNKQGADVGTQYRSAIFYHSEEQKAVAEVLIGELERVHLWKKPIITQIVTLDKFYPAENYHQEYFSRNPEQAYCQMVISPKMNKFRQQWTKRLKKSSMTGETS